MRSALLVIDIQIDNIKPTSPYPFPQNDVTSLIESANRLISKWEDSGDPIFLVRQTYDGFWGRLISKLLLQGITLKGEPGAELDERLKSDYGTLLDKKSQNSFHQTGLSAQLQQLRVSEVYICGLDGAYCVAATADGALKAGFIPTLISDAILTNKPVRAKKLLDKLKAKGAQTCKISDIC